MIDQQFSAIIQLIKDSRANAVRAVNTELINLYWKVGAYITMQLQHAHWGEKTVDELAIFIQRNHSELKGFNRRGLYRMKQFYETYANAPFVTATVTQIQDADSKLDEIVSSLMTQLDLSKTKGELLTKISWTHHLAIMSRCKTDAEREFCIRLCIRERYSVRELERQINSGVFERTMLGAKISPSLQDARPDVSSSFKDSYVFEFLNLAEPYKESDLQKALIRQMKDFILELDRDIKRCNENPSIGILLCKDKDNEVVEYALSRSLSPTLVSEYKTQLPDKRILQQKLHELFQNDV